MFFAKYVLTAIDLVIVSSDSEFELKVYLARTYPNSLPQYIVRPTFEDVWLAFTFADEEVRTNLLPNNSLAQETTVCTQDVTICANGAIRFRTGPECKFAPCPSNLPEDDDYDDDDDDDGK